MTAIGDWFSLQHSLRTMLTWFVHPQSGYLDKAGSHVVEMIGNHIAQGYRVLDLSRAETEEISVRAGDFDRQAYVAADPAYLEPIGELYDAVQDRLGDHFTHFFLHGSLATLDYARGWSDVDTFVVVSRDTATDGRRLSSFRKKCISAYPLLERMDPLQHHGFILATELDLTAYPAVFMPPPVFSHALSLLPGAAKITFRVRDDAEMTRSGFLGRAAVFEKAARTGVFEHHAFEGEYLKAGWSNADNAMYQLKYFLAYLMTSPAHYLEAAGRGCHKRDSFAMVHDTFAGQWGIIERASRIRSEWPDHEDHPFRGNAVPRWVRGVLGDDYLEKGQALMGAMAERLKAEPAADAGRRAWRA